jgi:hypothetical protein
MPSIWMHIGSVFEPGIAAETLQVELITLV